MKRITRTLALVTLIALVGPRAEAVVCVTVFEEIDYLEIVSQPGLGSSNYQALTGVWFNGDNRASAAGTFINGLATFCTEEPLGGSLPYCFLIRPTGGGSCLYDLYQPDHCVGGDPDCGYIPYVIDGACTIDTGLCPQP